MKRMKNKTAVGLFVAALTSVVSAHALADSNWSCDIRSGSDSEGFTSCWSAGAGYSLSYLNPDENNGSWTTDSDTDSGWLVYANYHFKPNWFAEVSYLDLGDASAIDKNTTRNMDGAISYEVPAVMLGYYFNLNELSNNAIPKLPISPFLKIGVSDIDNSTNPSSIPYEEKSDTQLAFGVGFDWRFHKNWKLRNQLESFDTDAVSYNLSLAYVFGGGKKASSNTFSEPAKPVQEAKPESLAVSAPAEPSVSEATCKLFEGSLDGVNFENGSADLTATAKNNLASTLAVLSEYTSLSIDIHAHTDWKGRGPANQVLSQSRAQSVMDYFIEQGITSSRLTAKGFGESQPIADNNSIEGRAKNRRVELKSAEQGGC
ncbi:MAG: OmpA family protein [Spongiibacteraceae bacterium]|nr:OmpA family protein [Spongiibacteraceae bacterium]